MCSGGGRGGGVGRVMLVGEWAGARLDGECSLTTRGIYWGEYPWRDVHAARVLSCPLSRRPHEKSRKNLMEKLKTNH